MFMHIIMYMYMYMYVYTCIQRVPTCPTPAQSIGRVLGVKLKLGGVNLEGLWGVCEEQVGNQVVQGNADVVLTTHNGVSSEGIRRTHIQWEYHKLREIHVKQDNTLSRDTDQENTLSRDTDQENTLSRDTDQENTLCRDTDQENTLSRDTDPREHIK